MSARLTRERARSVVATPQAKLKDARRALRAAATLIRDAASMGCMAEATRLDLHGIANDAETVAWRIGPAELQLNVYQSSLRARRSRKAA